ncbi:MAG: polymerase I protein, partial [Candidatus Moranbacteria bacterium GW2011_GWF2_37_7]
MDIKNKPKLVLIDSHALIHRAYHALPSLATQKGEVLNAVFGYVSVFLKILKEMQPQYIVAAFDLPQPTFRHEEFEEYKAHRPKAPDELITQFNKVKEVMRAFGVPVMEMPGYEADDVLGTICEKVKNKKLDVVSIILTGDLDTLQLVDDG